MAGGIGAACNDSTRMANDTPPRFALGLVVGKFAPLHAGHLHLIDQAARQSRQLLILSWCRPEPDRCPAEARRRWLAECLPAHECWVFDDATLATACQALGQVPRTLPPDAADDATQQHFLAWLVRDVLDRRPDAMFASEDYLRPCTQVLAQTLGQPVAAVMVDRHRTTVPVRATDLRRDPHGGWQHLPPAVRADFTGRVCLLGGESSGKTTLAAALAQQHQTVWVAEYGRACWEQRSGQLQEADMLHIAEEQQAQEDAAARQANRWLFCDTSALTTLFYSLHLFGCADPEVHRRAERPYDLVVLCEADFPFVQDGTRQDPAFRDRQNAWYWQQLQARGVAFVSARGSVAERVTQVTQALRGHPPSLAMAPGLQVKPE
jgi:HTH-type transcriptional repressor of NAD biosynthesis genes